MIDFEIELHGDMMHNIHIHGHGLIRFPSKDLIFDPSVLHYLMSCTVKENEYVIYLPDTLLKLINLSKENNEYRNFLIKFLTYFSYSRTSAFNENSLRLLYSNMDKLKIKPITLENVTDMEKYKEIVHMFEIHEFYISMGPKINFSGDVIGKIIAFSKTKGIAILSKTRRLSNLLRERIMALELPKRFDKAVMSKQEIVGKLFDFQGGKATKFFIGIALSLGGFIHPAIGVPGLMFAFMDP